MTTCISVAASCPDVTCGTDQIKCPSGDCIPTGTSCTHFDGCDSGKIQVTIFSFF